MKTVELLIDEDQETHGIEAISLVKYPAIEEGFLAFASESKMTFAKIDQDRQMLIGPALIPNKMIPRYNADKDEEYEVYFSEETVARALMLFMKEKRTTDYTIDHKEKVEGLSVYETWIIEDPDQDKSKMYGFDLPKGTWMVSVKVENEEVWKDIKEQEYKGFSIEGYFVDRLVKMQETLSRQDIVDAIKDTLKPFGKLDGCPVFETQIEAILAAEVIGCSGSHKHEVNGKTLYMPCKSHDQAKDEDASDAFR